MTQDELLKLIDQTAKEGWSELYLADEDVTELPAAIGQLTHLETLIVGRWDKTRTLEPKLRYLPPAVGQLRNLKHLYLFNNGLCELPAEIGQLANLKLLELSYNGLRKLPAEIGNLTNLETLYLLNNKLSELPIEIGQLTNLKYLDISTNELKELPTEIGRLTNLHTLECRHNELIALPAEIKQLSSLECLDLSVNKLRQFPSGIESLHRLHKLILSANKISSLPAKVGQLINLEHLDLSSNPLQYFSPEIRRLTNLQLLNLSDSDLEELPAVIGQISNLNSLDVSYNKLSKLPAQFRQLTNLNYLDIRANQLSEILVDIGKLKSLQHLYLRDNKLNRIPVEIAQLSNLQNLDINHNNLLEDPPPEIIKKGTQAILNYLQQKLEQGLDHLYEAKLLVVGEGGAGKTSLVRKLLSPSYELDSQETSTEGIEVIRWDFQLSNGKDFRANIWDFGGQEIYHATHQFFLTKRSLYVLVVDTRQDNTDLYYWLSVVKTLGKGSPILIVKNEKQDRQCEVNERQIRGEFENIRETLPTNLKTNRSLDEIKQVIQHYIINLPHVGTELPKKWVNVRHALETDERNYISLSEYIQICKENGFDSEEDQLQLSEYLHDLGVILHFQDNSQSLLKNYIILKPEWGTTAVYKALDTQEIKDDLGRFCRDQLDTIWNETQYASMQDELLQLMMRFKLCYLIPGTDGQYIAPQLLAANSPNYHWDESDNLLLRYKYEFMPKGILTRFIVEIHRFIEGQKLVWRTGVVLTNDSARAEVLELYYKGEIHIRVSGSLPRDLLNVITHEVDQINNSYDRIRVDKQIPCNCSLCVSSGLPYFFPLDTLQRSLGKSSEIQCQESFEMVNAQKLIHGIGDYIIYMTFPRKSGHSR